MSGQERAVNIFLYPSYFPQVDEGILAVSNQEGKIIWVADVPKGSRKDTLRYLVQLDSTGPYMLTAFMRVVPSFAGNDQPANYFAFSYSNIKDDLHLEIKHVENSTRLAPNSTAERISIEGIETWGDLKIYALEDDEPIEKVFLKNKLRLKFNYPPNADFYATLKGNQEDRPRYIYIRKSDLDKNRLTFSTLSNKVEIIEVPLPDERNLKIEIGLKAYQSNLPCGNINVFFKENNGAIPLYFPSDTIKMAYKFKGKAIYNDTLFQFRVHQYAYDYTVDPKQIETIKPEAFTPSIRNGNQDEIILTSDIPNQRVQLTFQMEHKENFTLWMVNGEINGTLQFKRPQFEPGLIQKSLSFPFSKEMILNGMSVEKEKNGVTYRVDFQNY